jgi:hypothetical protein
MSATARKHDAMLRIDRRTNSILSNLARETGLAKKVIVARAVERMRRERLLDAMNAGYAALKASPDRWAEELEERQVWDNAAADGLANE